MPTRVNKVNGIIITVTVAIQTVGGFGIKIRSIIRRDKSSPFGGVVSSVEAIPTCLGVEVITSVSNSIIHREKSVVNNQIPAYPALFARKLIKKGLKK